MYAHPLPFQFCLPPSLVSGMNKCEHLVQADRHIAECKARIERQRQVIQQAEQRGQNTLWAKETLKTWEESLRVFENHRQMILDRLNDPDRRCECKKLCRLGRC